MKLPKIVLCSTIAASIGFSATVTAAATATGTMAVTALVADTCTISATPLAFATLSASTVTNEVAPAVISVICTSAKTGATITLGGGLNENSGQRRMIDATTNYVPYNVFSDAAHGSGVAVDGAIYSGNLTAIVPTLVNVYGQVPQGSYAFGAYADAVTVTLNY